MTLNQWKTIDTAPKDGTVVLVANKWKVHCAAYIPQYPQESHPRPEPLCWVIDETTQVLPFVTHWMEVPSVPKG